MLKAEWPGMSQVGEVLPHSTNKTGLQEGGREMLLILVTPTRQSVRGKVLFQILIAPARLG